MNGEYYFARFNPYHDWSSRAIISTDGESKFHFSVFRPRESTDETALHCHLTDNPRLITLYQPLDSRASKILHSIIWLTSRRPIQLSCSLRRGGRRAGRRDGRRRRQRPAFRRHARSPVVVPQQALDGERIQPLSLLSTLNREINATALNLLLVGGLPDQVVPGAGADRLLTARSDDTHELASSLQEAQTPMMNTGLVVQMLHRRVLRILSGFRGLVRATIERRIALAVHGTVGRGVHPLASALAAGIQPADHVDLLVGVVTGRGDAALAVQAQLAERTAQGTACGAATRRRLATRFPFGAQRRQVHCYTLKLRNSKGSINRSCTTLDYLNFVVERKSSRTSHISLCQMQTYKVITRSIN